MRYLVLFLWISACLGITGKASAQDISFYDTSLIKVIEELEEKTNYRFLYREALVNQIKITLKSTQNAVLEDLQKELKVFDIGMRIDDKRQQALLFTEKVTPPSKNVYFSGFIIDNSSGERLPYATVAWREGGVLTGTASTNSGAFYAELETEQTEITLLFSFIGYASETITLDISEKRNWDQLAIRLEPQEIASSEIIINGLSFYTAKDSVYKGLVKGGQFNPLGENNAIRSLQGLPAVQTNTAINDGLNIRGSSADGFKVLLDGITIYSQTHLFGLLDSFNSDVLQSSGFFYDITPAQIDAPLGGTLSLITKTGSLREHGGNFGLSNTSIRGTIDGPIVQGKSSFLFSGRHSFLNTADILNNNDLIQWGLDINRPQGITQNTENLEQPGLNITGTNARFYDLHGKLYTETKSGASIQASGYIGQDNTRQDYTRCLTTRTVNNVTQEIPCIDTTPLRNRARPFNTSNNWGNNALSLQIKKPINSHLFSTTLAGFSFYNMDYFKGDFLFVSGELDSTVANTDRTAIRAFSLKNTLDEFKFSQTYDFGRNGYSGSLGLSYTYYESDFLENSDNRVSFLENTKSGLVDIYSQFDYAESEDVNFFFGNRIHYYSNGKYLRWSPRYKLEFLPSKPASFSLGYSRNYQFVNRVTFDNVNTADVWILSDEVDGPAAVTQITSGMYLKLSRYTFFQVEGYLKDFDNIRLHELSTRILKNTLQSDTPILSQTSGIGKGLEFLMRNTVGKFEITTNYTISSIKIENPFLNEGEPFFPDWDRRRQFSSSIQYFASPYVSFNAAWTLASGAPNTGFALEQLQSERQNGLFTPVERLDIFSRLDFSINFVGSNSGQKTVEANIFLFNVLDRENVWYRDFIFAARDIQLPNQLPRTVAGVVPTDVFDLGFQPSFNITFFF